MENRKQSFILQEDKTIGFKNAVRNGQFRLALEYSVSIIEELESRIRDLEGISKKIEVDKQDTLSDQLPKAEVKKSRSVKKENEETISQ